MSSGRLDFQVTWPEEWVQGLSKDDVTDVFPPQVFSDDDTGAKCFMSGMLLKDGTNLWCVGWPGGQRCACLRPQTDWALEERYAGKLKKSHRAVVSWIWKVVLESMVRANRETREEERSA